MSKDGALERELDPLQSLHIRQEVMGGRAREERPGGAGRADGHHNVDIGLSELTKMGDKNHDNPQMENLSSL